MTHDPLCGFNRPGGEFDFMAGSCARCEFITKVRADALDKALAAVELLMSEPLPKTERGGPSFIRKSAAMDAIDALRGES